MPRDNFRNEAHAPTSEHRRNVINILEKKTDEKAQLEKKEKKEGFLLGSGKGKKVAKNNLKRKPKGAGIKKVKTKATVAPSQQRREPTEEEKREDTDRKKALQEHMGKLEFSSAAPKKKKKNVCTRLLNFLLSPLWVPLIILRSLLKNAYRIVSKSMGFAYAWVMWEFFGRVTHSVNREQYLLERYMDNRGELIAAFRFLRLSDEDKLRWVELWSNIDDNEDNSMDEGEFVEFFGLTEHRERMWIKRFFGIFNRNFNGFVNIRDFLVTAWQYCSFDKDRVAELAFRLISRRGDVYDPEITIVDLEDMVLFVQDRYDPLQKKNSSQVRKIAVSIFAFLDVDQSGGVQFDEFQVFCKQNPIFLYYAYWLVGCMREKIFGDQYWRDATNDRPELYCRDVMQENMLKDNFLEQSFSIGIHGREVQKKKGNKFRADFPEAWYAEKEKAFNLKQKYKDRQDLASEMAKQTYSRMIKVFTRLVPDSIGVRPAFNIWKDVTEYTRSLEEDGGESYALNHMSLLDVKDAVRAQSCGLGTSKLLHLQDKKASLPEEELTIHEKVLMESRASLPTEKDVFTDVSAAYELSVAADNKARKIDRILQVTERLYGEGDVGERRIYLHDDDDDYDDVGTSGSSTPHAAGSGSSDEDDNHHHHHRFSIIDQIADRSTNFKSVGREGLYKVVGGDDLV